MSDQSSGQIIGGVIGAVLTFIPGVNIAVGVGFAIGSAIGGAIGAEDQTVTGPRQDDLQAQTSSYGKIVPIGYATVQVAGNVFWLKGDRLTERSESEEVGGKGGGGTTRTTYNYFATFAVSLLDREVRGVRRIWADADLIYDATDNASSSALFEQELLDQGEDGGSIGRVTLYRGTLTQQPDARIEADKGRAPAYRGTSYLLFDDLPVGPYGDRIPSIRAEVVVASGSGSDSRPTFITERRLAWPNIDQNELQTATSWIRFRGSEILVSVDPDNPTSGNKAPNTHIYTYSLDGDLLDQFGATYLQEPGSSGSDTFIGFWGPFHVYVQNGGNGNVNIYREVIKEGGGSLSLAYQFLQGDSHRLVATITPDQKHLFLIREETDNNFQFAIYSAIAGFAEFIESGSLVDGAVPVPDKIEANGTEAAPAIENDLSRFWVAQGHRIVLLERNAQGDFEAVGSNDHYASITGSSLANVGVTADKGIAAVFYRDYFWTFAAQALVARETEPLQTIVEDMAARAGLAAAEVDAASLSGDVRGYTVSRVTAMRQTIGQLSTVFPFDVLQDGYRIRFAPRGQSSSATLTDADLAAHEPGQDPPALVSIERALETELPRRIHITYPDYDRDYEAGDQYAARIATQSERIVRMDVPVVLTADEAARVVDVQLRAAWAQQLSLRAVASWQQAARQPADVVTLDASTYSGTARIRQIDDGRPGLLKMALVPDEPGAYISDAVGDTSDRAPQEVSAGGPTLYELLDLPALRDQDTGGGFYVALTGIASWPGATLFREDNGPFVPVLASTTRAVLGYTTDALGDGPTAIWDRGNSVNVAVNGGTLAAATETEVLNGANTAVLATAGGWEVIQFADATLEADGSYTLSTLLRGRRGTEWATAGHATRDRFVLLQSNGAIQRIARDTDTIGTTREYKAVTRGAPLDSAGARSFTYAGENLVPYSPVHIRGARDSAGDLTVSWVRRSRIGGAWRDRVGVTLSEESEAYELDVMDGVTVVRTISVTSPSATYTASEQITDFGAVQPGVTVRIYQISADVGRGHKGEATV